MPTSLLFPLLLVLLVGFMFFGTRKQKRAQQAQQDMQKSLSFGDRVMTTSGLYATVAGTADDTIDLEIAPGVVTTWLRAAVREKVDPTATDVVEESDDEEYEAEDAADETVEDSAEVEHTTNGSEPASGAQVAPPLEESSKKSR